MLASLTSMQLESDPHRFGNPSRFSPFGKRSRPDANSIGIWKAYVPRGMKAELNNYDPIGLIAGALIHADCSLNWRDPDNGKLYCFASAASLLSFQDWPKANSRKASDALERMKKEDPQY